MAAIDRQIALRALRRVGTTQRLSRIDLIATKVFSAPRRPQDLADLRDINPTPEELDWVLRHLDRLEAEDLDRQTFDDQRAVVAGMRGAP